MENGNKRREMEEQRGEIKRGEGMRELQKRVGEKKTFAMPIIFKELRTGPRTRISKMENVGIHHAVGM